MINEKLIRDTMAEIRRNPHTWDQSTLIEYVPQGDYFRMCFVGHALAQSGYTPVQEVRPSGFTCAGFQRLGGTRACLPGIGDACLALGMIPQELDLLWFFLTADVERMAERVTYVTGITGL